MEEAAFSRWQEGKFLDVEHAIAKQWRANLAASDLKGAAEPLRKLGVDGTTCRTLEDAHRLATAVVSGSEKHFERMALLLAVLQIPYEQHYSIIERWSLSGYKPIDMYAPYCAHILTVELFFRFAMAAGLIGTDRPSNRLDIGHLYYLPFCNLFVSSDKLHRKCAPLFLRDDQQFVWGPDLKEDLGQINVHFMGFPDREKDTGIMAFAHAPPNREGSIVRQLRAEFMGAGYDDAPPVALPSADDPKTKALVEDIMKWGDAPTIPDEDADAIYDIRPDAMTFRRTIRKRVCTSRRCGSQSLMRQARGAVERHGVDRNRRNFGAPHQVRALTSAQRLYILQSAPPEDLRRISVSLEKLIIQDQ
jgi:hypothetical protein